MRRANPDIKGDLMRKLTENGVDGAIMAVQTAFVQSTRGRRPRYVQGWRP